MVGPLRPALIATFAGLIIILLIACANVAALILGQIEARTGELAVRTALGADRGRLVAQLFAEVLLIGTAASLVGAALAPLGFRLLHASLPLGVWSARPSLDWTVFALVIAGSVIAAMAIAIIPAFTLWHADVRDALAAVRSGAAPRQSRLQNIMVVAEVRFAVLLACFAGLVGRSVEKLYAMNPGIETNRVAVIDVAAPTGSTDAERLAMAARSMQRIASLSDVQSVAGDTDASAARTSVHDGTSNAGYSGRCADSVFPNGLPRLLRVRSAFASCAGVSSLRRIRRETASSPSS